MRGHSKLIRVPSLLYTEFMSALFGDANLHFLSVVLYDFLLAVGGDNGELALLEHTRIAALALADGQSASLIVPLESDSGVLSLLVVVVVALVLIERETAPTYCISGPRGRMLPARTNMGTRSSVVSRVTS